MLSDESAKPTINIPAIPWHLVGLRNVKLAAPREYVLLVTMSRPKALNVFTEEMEDEMRRVMEWAEVDEGVW